MPADNLNNYKKGDVLSVRYAGSNPGVTRTDTITVEKVKGEFIVADSGYSYHQGTILGFTYALNLADIAAETESAWLASQEGKP